MLSEIQSSGWYLVLLFHLKFQLLSFLFHWYSLFLPLSLFSPFRSYKSPAILLFHFWPTHT